MAPRVRDSFRREDLIEIRVFQRVRAPPEDRPPRRINRREAHSDLVPPVIRIGRLRDPIDVHHPPRLHRHAAGEERFADAETLALLQFHPKVPPPHTSNTNSNRPPGGTRSHSASSSSRRLRTRISSSSVRFTRWA